MAVTKTTSKGSGSKKSEPPFITRATNYVKESWAESRRATWPTMQDIQRLTIAVFSGLIIVTVYLFALDVIFTQITKLLFGL